MGRGRDVEWEAAVVTGDRGGIKSRTWHLQAICIKGCYDDDENDDITRSAPFRPASNSVLDSMAMGIRSLQTPVHNLAPRDLMTTGIT